MFRLVQDSEYMALAEFRQRIRGFLRGSDESAHAAGLEPQQYLLLLTLRGLPAGVAPTVGRLAERMFLRHHSAVELLDRLEAHGYVRRERSDEDHRRALIKLQPRGAAVLEKVARQRLDDLRANGHALVDALGAVLHGAAKAPRTKSPAGKARISPNLGGRGIRGRSSA